MIIADLNDSDGEYDFEQFVVAMETQQSVEEQTFAGLDISGDGKLTRSEL